MAQRKLVLKMYEFWSMLIPSGELMGFTEELLSKTPLNAKMYDVLLSQACIWPLVSHTFLQNSKCHSKTAYTAINMNTTSHMIYIFVLQLRAFVDFRIVIVTFAAVNLTLKFFLFQIVSDLILICINSHRCSNIMASHTC